MPEVPAETGSLLSQRAGPLPMWGWGVVILGGAYGYKLYRGRKGAAEREPTPTTGYSSADLPSNIQPQYTQINEGGSQSYVNSPISVIGRQQVEAGGTGVEQDTVYGYAPPRDGSATPPPSAPPAKVPTPPKPAPAPNPPAPPKPAPQPVHVPAPPAPAGKWVTTVKWNPNDRNAPSTLTGLSLLAYGNAGAWQKIWNAPQNADLVRRRGSPSKIQPGDKFWAPA